MVPYIVEAHGMNYLYHDAPWRLFVMSNVIISTNTHTAMVTSVHLSQLCLMVPTALARTFLEQESFYGSCLPLSIWTLERLCLQYVRTTPCVAASDLLHIMVQMLSYHI